MIEWISVDERMPETHPGLRYTDDLLVTDGIGVYMAFYHAGKGTWRNADSGKRLTNITYWIPLPDPPVLE